MILHIKFNSNDLYCVNKNNIEFISIIYVNIYIYLGQNYIYIYRIELYIYIYNNEEVQLTK